MYRAPWIFRHFCFGIFDSCQRSLTSCLKTNLPSRLWAYLEGLTPDLSVPQWATLPAYLSVWWHLCLCPFLFLTVSTSCYIMHLFSTCDSTRYLVSGFFHPLCFDNSLPSVWKDQGGISSFRCCSPHLAGSRGNFSPYNYCISSQVDFRQGYLVHPEISLNDFLCNAHMT